MAIHSFILHFDNLRVHQFVFKYAQTGFN